MQTIWTRSTPNFTVALSCEYDTDLDLSWDDTGETAEKLESGEWGCYVFCVRVIEKATGVELGADYLGGSIYADPSEFIDHRACGRANRAMDEAVKAGTRNAGGGRCGSYFTGMIREVCDQARKTYAMQRPHLRAA